MANKVKFLWASPREESQTKRGNRWLILLLPNFISMPPFQKSTALILTQVKQDNNFRKGKETKKNKKEKADRNKRSTVERVPECLKIVPRQ